MSSKISSTREISLKKVLLEESESEDDEESYDKVVITEKLFQNYDGNKNDVSRIVELVENGEVDCLICIRRVRSDSKIWNCSNCYCTFHLLCIQKWANDSISQKRLYFENQPLGYYNNAGVYIPRKESSIYWDCPQCRLQYTDIPRVYECYCGKERDPLPQPFLIPHSCGEVCGRPLNNPQCGHVCYLLCHPGPHPTCPQILQKSCECGKSPIKSIRCSQQYWSCNNICLKKLSCGHNCGGICHKTCPPCNKSSVRFCLCRGSSKEIKCKQEFWSCQKVCKKILSCDVHLCEKKCHEGDCGSCIYGLKRSCFCGKQSFISESCGNFTIESCGDTCLKPLACGNPKHLCYMRCHKGECDTCKELIEKNCRCGAITKKYPCSKELLCETKCKNIKSCKKHNCNRKCCVECLPCDRICSKTLSCGKHKCNALCHGGNCYPCSIKQQIKCRCGATSVSVVCGRKNRIPKCRETCKLPSKCHHDPSPHKCHFGECPPCTQTCDELLPCLHKCLANCHDFVKVVKKDKSFIPKLPGEIAEQIVEMKKIDHPQCFTKVQLECLGGHEIVHMKCHEAKVFSCGRSCNRKLECGNHFCQLNCHSVNEPKSENQDANCEDCDKPCEFERFCPHPCQNPCHPNACKKCRIQVKTKCFCGLNDAYFRCCDVFKKGLNNDEIDNLKAKYLSCGLRCIKNYSCGHQCVAVCHNGECPDEEFCKKKVKLICECKTRKIETTCDKVRAEKLHILPCDETCEEKRKKAEELKDIERKKQEELEAERNRQELEAYEKKIGGRKHRERKPRFIEEEKSNKNVVYILIVISAVVAVVIGYLMTSM